MSGRKIIDALIEAQKSKPEPKARVECGKCGWTGWRKVGQIAICPKCNFVAAFQS